MKGGGARGLLAYFIAHRTAANLLMALMLLAGVWGGLSIRQQFFPDVVIETVTVSVAWTGAGPEEVDRQIVAVLEPALLAVEGVESTSSVAREGAASLTLQFEPDWDMGRAADDVRAAIDAAEDLPDAAERPEVRRGDFRDRVTEVVVSGPVGVDQLTRIASELQARLFRAGVTRTRLSGVVDPVIRVAAQEAALIRHGVSLREIADALAAEASARPAGDLGAGGARVRAGVESRTAEAIGAVLLRVGPDGARLTVRDVAEVRVEGVEKAKAFFVGADPAVTLMVERDALGDAVAIQRAVERAADEVRPTLPQGVAVELTRTRAQAITDRLDLLVRNGLMGLALVLGFLFLFLSARTAFWVAMGIPAAMAATVALMYLSGLSLNMISLFALIIVLGVVVDDAIVVGEHADMLARRGLPPAQAAETAARRMFAPVFAASLTTVIAFLGLVVIGGRFGSLILAIPLTVAMVMIASLIESFLVLPAHMRHALSARSRAPWFDAPSRVVDRGFGWFRDRAFRPFLRLVVAARYAVIGAAVALLLYSVTLLTGGDLRWRFFDAPEGAAGAANFAMLPGATRADTEAMLAEAQRALDSVAKRFEAEHGRAPLKSALGVVGGSAGRGLSGVDAKDADLLGGLSVELIDADARPYSQSDFLRAWEDEIRPQPALETLALRGERAGPGGDAISVELIGFEPRTLKAAAEALKQGLRGFPAVSGLEDTLAWDKEELSLTLTPRGAALGFDIAAVGAALRARLAGIEAASFPLDARSATVEVSLDEAALTADYLSRARLRAPGGAWAPLSEVVEVSRSLGFSAIRRSDGFPVVTVTGEIDAADTEAAAAVTEALSARLLPDLAARFDVTYRLTGLAEQERDFLADARKGFALVLAGIYVALAWVFASWTRPLVVLLAIPLGLIGVLWGHLWMGAALSMFSVVGLIGMTGIVINDSIVLVTTVDDYARRRALIPALIDAVADRLRAVFLTTATTVAGLAPLLFETSTQAQFLKPTVITLAFGLGFGMALVLVVTPALIAAQHDIARALASARRLWPALRPGGRRARLSPRRPSA